MDDKAIQQVEDAALTLLSGHSTVVSAVLNYITGTAMQEIVNSLPTEVEKREAAYRRVLTVQEIDQLIRNFATQAEARRKNSNPA